MAAKPLLPDYHIHTRRCGHADGAPEEYLARAQDLGLAEAGFSDHLPLFHTIDSTLAMGWDELPLYYSEVSRLRAATAGSVRVKMGIEADYLPKYVEQTAAVLDDYDFDYILGSVHFVDGWGIDDRRYLVNYDAYDLAALYEKYFDLVIEAAQTGLFDIIAHPDLIKKYFQLTTEPAHLYERAASAFAQAGVAVELSSAGLRKPCRQTYPSPAFLAVLRGHGVPVTLGSDAHLPQQVGDNFKLLLEQLSRAGYSEIALFDQRKREMVEIDWSLLETLPTS